MKRPLSVCSTAALVFVFTWGAAQADSLSWTASVSAAREHIRIDKPLRVAERPLLSRSTPSAALVTEPLALPTRMLPPLQSSRNPIVTDLRLSYQDGPFAAPGKWRQDWTNSLSTIPEPPTLICLAVGIGGLGFVFRRRGATSSVR